MRCKRWLTPDLLSGGESDSPNSRSDISGFCKRSSANSRSSSGNSPNPVDSAIFWMASTCRAAADAVLVFVHWGDEYAETPNKAQTAWAQIFADGGADVVLGTHPHVRQPWAWVEGQDGHETLVYYSLGNCLSAQTGEACRLGSLAAFTLTRTPEGVAVTPEPLRTV